MNLNLGDDAATFGDLAHKALQAAGGDTLLQQAERDPSLRAALVEPVLARLGAWDLNPAREPDELEAAAALCRSAGWWAVPYPVAERLARPRDLLADGLVVVGGHAPAAPIAGLGGRWVAVTIEGHRAVATAATAGAAATATVTAGATDPGPRKTAFVTPLVLQPIDEAGHGDVVLGLVLPCWTLLGMVERALALTRDHVLHRRQFGQRLADFQGVQFQLTDAEVERMGAEELGKYALWSIQSSQPGALGDALAFRLAALEAAAVAFRTAHQLHGALGFCDETVLSWVSRYSAPLRRLPFGASGTTAALRSSMARQGFSGLFDPAGPA